MTDRVITLGGRQFTIAPFTLDQLQELTESLKACNALSQEGIGHIRTVLAAALSGQTTPEEFGALPTTLHELWIAQIAVQEVSGLDPLLEGIAARYAAIQRAAEEAGTTSTQRSP